jgi:hypothetical protein
MQALINWSKHDYFCTLYRKFHNVLRDYKYLQQENQWTYLNWIVHSHKKTEKVFSTTIDFRCVHHWWHRTHRYDIQVLATHVPTWVRRYFSLLQWSLYVLVRPTIATWRRWPKGTDHCSSEEYRFNHADACVARNWTSYRIMPCYPWCTHRTSLVVKSIFSFSVAVNNSIKVGPLVSWL